MKGAFSISMLSTLLALTACGTDLDVGTGGDTGASEEFVVAPGGSSGVRADDVGSDGTDDDGTEAPDEPDTTPDVPAVDEPASGGPGTSPPPSETTGSCAQWQDCGPHYGDLNSGFDCDAGQCACNVASDHDDDCRAIGGLWSDQECFCFVTSSRPPEPADDDTSYDDRDDDAPYCWWRYREECDGDRWVDTSYYERVCRQGVCNNVWRRDGYYEDGDCVEVWTRRCDDGSQVVFRN